MIYTKWIVKGKKVVITYKMIDDMIELTGSGYSVIGRIEEFVLKPHGIQRRRPSPWDEYRYSEEFASFYSMMLTRDLEEINRLKVLSENNGGS